MPYVSGMVGSASDDLPFPSPYSPFHVYVRIAVTWI